MDAATHVLTLADDHLVLDFPYDAAQVAEIKLIPGSKWDKVSKVWRVPATSIRLAREFCQKYNYSIAGDVLRLTVPEQQEKAGLSLNGEFIFLTFAYDPVKVRSVKQIPGITWHAKSKAWRAPLTSIKTAIKWAETFKQHIPVELVEAAENVENSLNNLREASRSTDAALKLEGFTGLMAYQRAGVEYAARARKCFIADEMGLGKTLQGIATLELVAQKFDCFPAVVICPANLVLNWEKEYAKWAPSRRVKIVKNRKDFPLPGSYDVVVVGYSNITTWEKQLTGANSYIFDESHYLKSFTAQRTKSALKMTKNLRREVPILCLTGTPVTSKPAEYAAQLEILGQLNKFGGKWGFYRRYCAAFQDKYGQWHLDGNSNLDELNDLLRSTCYIRRTKSQVLKDLPPVLHSIVTFEGAPAAVKEYRAAEDDVTQFLRDNSGADMPTQLARISILRRLAAQAKMPAVIEWVQERVDAGKKVVIAAHHRDVVDALAQRFGGLKIQGSMTVEEVEENKQKFQDLPVTEAPVIVLSIQAAKTGHTLTAAQDILFVELPWTPADVQQTFSRLHRIGQLGSVTATYALLENSIDEDIHRLLERKLTVVTEAIDGASGQEVILSLLGRRN
jgi:SWI/SNF-related matrix-associated actin-dependent regulator 1 of chromatin subfamily A